MGNSLRSKDTKKTLLSKVDMASKTGSLNLSKQQLCVSSDIFSRISEPHISLKIKTLDISGNNFKGLPDNIVHLSNIKILNASRCNLQRVYSLVPLSKLKTLLLENNDLDDNSLASLPTSIIEINFSFNHFKIIPSSVLQLIHLVQLNLSSNRLLSIQGIGQLVALEDCILDDNQLTELPADISALVKLRHISIKRNNLILTSSITKLPFIPVDFLTSTTVDHIELNGNKNLHTSDVLGLPGIDIFLERRRQTKSKALEGGAMLDHSLFGLD